MEKQKIVLKVGGSILSTSQENIFNFENAFGLKDTLLEFTETNQFIICVGGGFLARKYQEMLKDLNSSNGILHDVGIAAINLNAEMLKGILGEENTENVVLRYEDYEDKTTISFQKNFLIGAAGIPGHSGDFNTVLLALRTNSKKIISLKNIDGVYTEDPKNNISATKIEVLSWDEYLDLIGNPLVHEPGKSYPVDPIASKLSQENGIQFIIINGQDKDNLKNVLLGKKFEGSIIG